MKTSLLCTALGLAAAAAPAQIFTYEFVDLGARFGGTASNAQSINDAGTIVLSDRVLSGNTVTAMPGLATGRSITGTAVNASGQVVGSGRTGSAASTQRAARFDPVTGTTTNLGGLGERSDARAINDSGVIVGAGRSTSAASTQRALRWSADGTQFNLASSLPAVESAANGVNPVGQVVGNGRSLASQTTTMPLLFDGLGGATALPLLDGTDRGDARDINSAGFVVGRTSGLTLDTARAALWNLNTGTVTELLKPTDGAWGGMTAISLNESNIVVGTGIVNGSDTFGVVWQNGQGYRLSAITSGIPEGYVIRFANDVDNMGRIVGYARLTNGDGSFIDRAFMLNPVPEPASMAALGLGLALLRRRNRSSQ